LPTSLSIGITLIERKTISLFLESTNSCANEAAKAITSTNNKKGFMCNILMNENDGYKFTTIKTGGYVLIISNVCPGISAQ
jgi:hypothetical protein